jgi:DNA invertase Pin-like site-specific DNA recombinase
MPMVFGYTRVSTLEQAADGTTSLQEQERIIRGFAMAKGIGAFDLQIYTDAGVSGSIPLKERPAGGEMMNLVKRYDTVVASKLDRIFRDSLDALTVYADFKKRGINLVLFDLGTDPVTSDTGMAKVVFQVMSAFADHERIRIRERVIEGKKAKAANGGHAGGEAPYGYRIVGERRNAKLEPVPEEQEVISFITGTWRELEEKEVFPRRRRRAILRTLRKKDIKTRTGHWFRCEQIQRILDRNSSAIH